MADPFEKATGKQSGREVVDGFILPASSPKTRASGGILGGKGPLAEEVKDDLRVVVYSDGTFEFYSVAPDGQEERVVPHDDYVKYVQTRVENRRKSASDAGKSPERIPAPPNEPNIVKSDGSATPNPNYQKPAPTATTPSTDAPNIVYSDGTTKPNPNYQPPKPDPTIERPRKDPLTGQQAVDTGANPLTEKVSPAQATFDFQMAQAEDARAQQRLMNEIALRKITADQARDQLTSIREGLALRLQESRLALSARGQDISVRGQDLDAGVSQRGQNLSFGASQARGAVDQANAMLPYLAAPGSNARMDYIINKGTTEGAPTVAPMAPPYDPRTFSNDVASRAMAMAPSMVMGAPVAPATLPSVSGQYDQAQQAYQKSMVMGGQPRYVLGQ